MATKPTYNAKIKLLYSDQKMPCAGSQEAAGLDVYAHITKDEATFVSNDKNIIMIHPHETVKISIGFAMTPPTGYFAAIVARSGLATKQGLRPAQGFATVDYDYTGELFVPLHNDSEIPRTVTDGDRIAQMIFIPYIHANLNVVDELDATERGAGGFGSTGTV